MGRTDLSNSGWERSRPLLPPEIGQRAGAGRRRGGDSVLAGVAAIAVAGIVLALLFLPRRAAPMTATDDELAALEDEAVVGG
jgi:hypothetical protein